MLILCVGPALACMCGETPSVVEAKQNAHTIFIGRVVSSEYQKAAILPNGKDPGKELSMRFKVERWWKGEVPAQLDLFTEQFLQPDLSIGISLCAFQFEEGKRYIVYAGYAGYAGFPIQDGRLRANYCSRTSEVEKASEDLKKLGKGKKPKSLNQKAFNSEDPSALGRVRSKISHSIL